MAGFSVLLECVRDRRSTVYKQGVGSKWDRRVWESEIGMTS